MSQIITGYHPEAFFRYFEAISAIPRGSENEHAVSDYIVAFAKEHQLSVYQDELYNVVVKKPGASDVLPVMLQGHLDMVCEKNYGCAHDFTRDPIRLIVKDGFVHADGTTLGADNGVAVALMLALLEDGTLTHPPLECVFTTQEETGLCGAAVLDPALLDARTMINLDSEDEGIATVSCAGGLCAVFSQPAERETAFASTLSVSISGLIGGHSGGDIHLERGNANKLMGRILLSVLNETDARILSLNGGNKDNAIPRECTAQFTFTSAKELEKAQAILSAMQGKLEAELCGREPSFSLSLHTSPAADTCPLSRAQSERLVHLLVLAPDGAQKRNVEQGGFIVTSVNLGVIRTTEDSLSLTFSPRSSVDSLQEELRQKLLLLGSLFGFSVSISGEYPGWSFAENSPIREQFCESYRRLFGSELKIESIHAGLECGLFCGKLPGLDAIAVGPSVYGCHTPEEKLDLASCERTWQLLTDVLASLCKK